MSVEGISAERAAASGGGAASLSMSHNSIGEAVEHTPLLPFRLTGSQRKTAYALEKNVARMIEEAGIERIGFLTLTVGDETPEGFSQVWEAEEASRRINSLLTGVLRDLFTRSVCVTERHKSGAIHFHLIVECRGDIRSGFDFAAFKAGKGYADSASDVLRALWTILRERLPSYGFGRSELAPIKSTGEAISRYVSKYVEKNLFNRRKEDKGKKLVRYHGWKGSQMKPNEFSWATPKACEWRTKARGIAHLAGVGSREEAALAYGPRWAWRLSRAMESAEGVAWKSDADWLEFVKDIAHRELVYPQWQTWLDDERRYEEFGQGELQALDMSPWIELQEFWDARRAA